MTGREPSLRMSRRAADKSGRPPAQRPKTAIHTSVQPALLQPMPLFHVLSDETLVRVRRDFPGWDVYSLKADFDAWLAENSDRQPKDYQEAFYGFMRQHHLRNRYA
jgi:hypothetical protein